MSRLTASTALQHALAAVAALVAVAQFHRFAGAGRSAGRHGGPAHGAVLEHHVDLDRRIAAAVEDFAGDDVDDGGHGADSLLADPPGSTPIRRSDERQTNGLNPAAPFLHICFVFETFDHKRARQNYFAWQGCFAA